VLGIQQFIYNISIKFLWHPEDAKDATQEVLIRIVTHLSSFKQESAFKTWTYRIAHNYLINHLGKQKRRQINFEMFAQDLAAGQNETFVADTIERKLLVEEVKIGCSTAMLQCLDPESRLTYLLGEILEFNSTEGAYIQQISPETFRKRLSRARAKINEFTQNHCGLVNACNACRCPKKVDDAIEKGKINPKNLLFASKNLVSAIAEVSDAAQLIRTNPVYDLPEAMLFEIRKAVSARF
jgi:RNA polymerase sigma factor (sigma-70 family)